MFINETVKSWCEAAGVEFTRSRPYRKNDQAHVEQKNGAIVRRMVGYRPLEGLVAAEALARLYRPMRLFVNFFQPSYRLAEKRREGALVRKRYHPPLTPHPFAGSRMLRDMLKVEGRAVGRRHVAPLMKKMGVEAIYRRPDTSMSWPRFPWTPFCPRRNRDERDEGHQYELARRSVCC